MTSSSSRDHPDLHSFPTRRSSDLFVIEIDDVFDARIASSRQTSPRLLKMASLSSSFSGAASMTTSQSCRSRCPPPDLRCARSEEHTSELQSHVNLVCRLLLEKKKH